MTKTKTKYILSDTEKTEYHGLVSGAFEAASGFTGSEATYEDLMNKLILMEAFVRARNGDGYDEKLEADFAKQAGFLAGQFNTVSNLMDHAVDVVYGMMGRLKELKELLNVLALGGAHIDQSNLVYVLNDGSYPSGEGEEKREITEFHQQPRLSALVKELSTIGIYIDDLVIRVGKVFEHTIRRLPYVVVEIPRLGKQVAVCDQYGETTFVSQNILHPHVWASYTKSQLKAMDGVQDVAYRANWPFRVCNLLEHGTDEMTPQQFQQPPKVNVHNYERKRVQESPNLTEDMIFNHELLYLKKHNRWPTIAPKEVDTLPKEQWGRWNDCLSKGRRTLSGGNSLFQLAKNKVAEQAKRFREKAGRLPVREDGPLPDYPDVTWKIVDDGFFANKGARTTLEKVLIEAGLKEGEINLSESAIFDHALLYLKKHKRWPTRSSKMVETMPGETWAAWNSSLIKGFKGLSGGSSFFLLFKDKVIEQAKKFEEMAGRLPTREDGPLPDYPDTTWEVIEDGFLAYAGARTTLEKILIEAGLKEGDLNLSEDLIYSHALLFLKKHKRWPSVISGNVVTMPGEKWMNWQAALQAGVRGLPKDSSLFQSLKGKTVEQAKKFEERAGRLPTREDESLPDYPDVTWEMIDDGFLANQGYRTTLEKVLIEAGLKEGELNLSENLIFDHALLYLQKHRRWPKQNSGDVETLKGERWGASLNNCLRKGRRGLPGGSSLPLLIKDKVVEQAKKFEEGRGRLPTREDGPLPNHPTVTWEMIDDGFLGGKASAWTTLEKVLREASLKEGETALSEDLMFNHALLYLQKHGHWPKQRSGEVETLKGEKWRVWDGRLRNGLLGLPGGSSLPLLIKDKVVEQAKKFEEGRGRLPTREDGPLPNYPNVTWAMADDGYLSNTPHNTSISALLAENLKNGSSSPETPKEP